MKLQAAPAVVDGITRYLSWDHDRLDGLLAEATRRVAEGLVPEARLFFEAFDHGLRRHIHIEETILFPAVATRSAALHSATDTLRHDHAAIEALLARTRASIETHDASDYGENLASLRAVLDPHHLTENQWLHPAIDGVITDPAERDRLLDRLIRA
jgi:hypothetical protein